MLCFFVLFFLISIFSSQGVCVLCHKMSISLSLPVKRKKRKIEKQPFLYIGKILYNLNYTSLNKNIYI